MVGGGLDVVDVVDVWNNDGGDRNKSAWVREQEWGINLDDVM